MNTGTQDIGNVREKGQRMIMEELAQTGECFLCECTVLRVAESYPDFATKPIHQGKHWFVKRNDFPYEGAKLHMLLIPKRHVTRVEELSSKEFLEIQEIIKWINETFAVRGASLFLRYGDTSYTGATGTHLHFHLLHGGTKDEGHGSIKPKLGYRCEPNQSQA